MHVGVEEAVAQRVAQEGLDHRARQMLEVEALGLQASRGRAAACRRSIPASARPCRCGPSRPSARGNPDRPWCSPPSPTARPLRAAGPSRWRPSGAACRRPRSCAAAAPPPTGSRPAARRNCSASRSTLEAPLDVRPQHLHGDRLAALRRDDLGAMHLGDRGRRHRRAERGVGLVERLAERAGDHRLGLACGNGAILSCSDSRSRASATPTTSGRVARNWPSLT